MDCETKTKTVLVVEDQLEMRIFLRTLLETNGFNPVLVADGRVGLQRARQIRPDVIVLDVMMPEEGGAIMYRNLKTETELRDIPVIMLSAVAARTFRHYLQMLNCRPGPPLPVPEAYIEKPPSPQHILQAVRACC